MVELTGLYKQYRQGQEKVKAADCINLRVDRGDFLLITGRSGSGKTTLLSLIGGLTAPSAGEIRIEGENLANMDDTRLSTLRSKQIGFVFQFPSLIPTLTAINNIRLPGLFSGSSPTAGEVQELLAWVGLADKAENYPSQLSGGQQTRIALARSLINRPPLLLADEPTGNLDSKTGVEIMALFDRLHSGGNTIVLVTHEADIAAHAHRVIAIRDGAVERDQPTERAAATVRR